jgi:hypothetical protein
MRIILATLLVIAWINSAASAQNGCLEPGDSDFVYPVGNIIKFCDEQRADNTCAKYFCTRCQSNGNWSEDYVCSKPDRVYKQ